MTTRTDTFYNSSSLVGHASTSLTENAKTPATRKAALQETRRYFRGKMGPREIAMTTVAQEKGTLKCVVEEHSNGNKYCKTHGYQLEAVRVSDFAPISSPNPIIDRAWRCPKGGTLIELFKCRNCRRPLEVKTRPANAGRHTVGEEYEPVKCPCGETYQSSEVA